MKNLYISFILLITTQLLASNLDWVDKQIQAIKPPRVGVSEKELSKIKSPFIFLNKKDNTKKGQIAQDGSHTHSLFKKSFQRRSIYLKLDAIINKSAMINGKWYEQGRYVHGYKLAKVYRKSVVLIRKNKRIFLSTKNRNKKITIKNK